MYSVTIAYAGIAIDEVRPIDQVCRVFVPKNSYVDSDVYKNGYTDSSDLVYGKSVYATNVDGFGHADGAEFYSSTSVPFPVAFAQFKLAMVGASNTVTFTVDDYKEAFYYMTIGRQMADQGFTVTVAEVEPEEDEGPSVK